MLNTFGTNLAQSVLNWCLNSKQVWIGLLILVQMAEKQNIFLSDNIIAKFTFLPHSNFQNFGGQRSKQTKLTFQKLKPIAQLEFFWVQSLERQDALRVFWAGFDWNLETLPILNSSSRWHRRTCLAWFFFISNSSFGEMALKNFLTFLSFVIFIFISSSGEHGGKTSLS